MTPPFPLPPGWLPRSLLLAAILATVAGTFAYTAGYLTPSRLSPEKFIDTFEHANGPHPGFRRNHAKGLGLRGHFDSNGAGAPLSRAAVFLPNTTTPVLGRFALAGGQPYQGDAPNTVRSLALLFQLPNHGEWRTGMNNIPAFPFPTPQAFYDQLAASVPDPATGKPDPAKIQAFFAAHPEAGRAVALIRAQPPTSGFADSTYNSLNAFRMTNGAGEVSVVRWAMVPEDAPAAPTSRPATPDDEKNFLFDALATRLRAGPIRFHLVLTLAAPEDNTADASIPWPATRKQVDVGTLTIDALEPEDASLARDTNFDPLILPDGISGSDDPLLTARSAAYSKSFTRRAGETKSPSAVTPAEVHP